MMKVFFLLMIILASSTYAFADEQSCEIMITPSTRELAILAHSGQELARFSGIGSELAPNQKYLAVQEANKSGIGSDVAIYDLSRETPVKIKALPNLIIIRGQAWSPDSQKLLLLGTQDESAFLLYLYDLNSDKLESLYKAFDPGLTVYQATWNDSGTRIAFAAEEAPFQRTEYGKVTALYVINPTTLAYRPVSPPDQNVDYYYSGFYWVGNDKLAFLECSASNNQCKVSLTNVAGETQTAVEGDYWPLDYENKNLLLALDMNSTSGGQPDANLVTIDLAQKKITKLFQLPLDPSMPLPVFSLSPDYSHLAYLTDKEELVIVDLHDMTTYSVDQAAAYDPGSWSPDGNELLFQSGSSLYIYDLQSQKSQLVYTSPNNYGLYERWLCVSKNT